MPRYTREFEPILLEGHTATLHGTGLPDEGLNVRCVAVGALPEYWNDFGALAAGAWSTSNTDTNLEMNTMSFAQYRMRVVSDMRLRLNHPGSVTQWRTKNTSFYLPQFPEELPECIKEFYWNSSEFFVFQDNTPEFDLYSSTAQVSSIVVYNGWRFKLQPISEPGKIAIWTSEWPTTSSTPRYPK